METFPKNTRYLNQPAFKLLIFYHSYQTRWYEVLKIMIGNWVERYDIVGTTKEVPTDFK